MPRRRAVQSPPRSRRRASPSCPRPISALRWFGCRRPERRPARPSTSEVHRATVEGVIDHPRILELDGGTLRGDDAHLLDGLGRRGQFSHRLGGGLEAGAGRQIGGEEQGRNNSADRHAALQWRRTARTPANFPAAARRNCLRSKPTAWDPESSLNRGRIR